MNTIDSFFKPIDGEKKISKKAPAKKATKAKEMKEVKASKEEAEAPTVDDNEEEDLPSFGSGYYSDLLTFMEPSWRKALKSEFKKPYFKKLVMQLNDLHEKGAKIFPPKENIFRAFELCPLDKARVVIIGQDPYHGPGQAEGLSFSVPEGVKVPSSLQNIYKELVNDIDGFSKPKHGHLAQWASQGVLLLNACLTVEQAKANAHKSLGWNTFTDAVIEVINKQCRGVVFILWGAFAQKKASFVSSKNHHILKGVHPSGLSANKGFFGCKHFSKTNAFLEEDGNEPIDWQV